VEPGYLCREDNMPKPKRIIAISDLHVGSTHGLCPNKVELEDGGYYKASPLQRAVYKEWRALIRKHGEPDVLFFLGDGIDGKQKKEFGKPCWTTSLAKQGEIFGELIDQWHAKKVYAIHGTGYHVACEGERMEEAVMQDVTNSRADANGAFAPPHRFVEVGGVVFHLCHKVGVTTLWKSRPTTLSGEMTKARESHSRGLIPAYPDIILRGHAHRYNYIGDGFGAAFTVPPWQLVTPYAAMNSPLSWLPEIGCIEFTVSNGQWRHEGHTIDFRGKVKGLEKA